MIGAHSQNGVKNHCLGQGTKGVRRDFCLVIVEGLVPRFMSLACKEEEDSKTQFNVAVKIYGFICSHLKGSVS